MNIWQIAGSGITAVVVTAAGIQADSLRSKSTIKSLGKELTAFDCTNRYSKLNDTSINLDQKNNMAYSPGQEIHFGYWRPLDHNTFEIATKQGPIVFDVKRVGKKYSISNNTFECKQVEYKLPEIPSTKFLYLPNFVEQAKLTNLYTHKLNESEKKDYVKTGKTGNYFFGPGPLKLSGNYNQLERHRVIEASQKDGTYYEVAKKYVDTDIADSICADRILETMTQYSGTNKYEQKYNFIKVSMPTLCPERFSWFLNSVPKPPKAETKKP